MTTSGNVVISRRSTASARRLTVFALLLAACCVLALAAQSPLPANAIGSIEGDDLLVQAAPNEAMLVKQGITPLDSGASVTVRTGQALVELAGGGEIGICGPAHFSVLQSGSALTLALDYGRVHPKLPPATSVMIYTPLIAATPIAIGAEQRDLVVGLASDGAMCVTSSQGAVRIAQQLSDQSVIVPEGGAISLSGGALAPAEGTGTCSCDVQLARNAPPPSMYASAPATEAPAIVASAPTESSVIKAPLPSVDAVRPAPTAPTTASTDDDQPIYQVFMPPLRFDASGSSSSTDPTPEMIVVVRHARVRPGALFVGEVEGAGTSASISSASMPPQSSSATGSEQTSARSTGATPAAQRPGVYQRVRSYLRNLFGNP